jgi:hypothetical protein
MGEYGELEKEAAAPTMLGAETLGLTADRSFYSAFRFEDWSMKPDWGGYFKALDGWEAAFPKSPYSRLARATALIGYAWEARGSGAAKTVTKNGWQLFGDRLIEGVKKLEEARKLGGDKEPVYWVNMLTFCRGLQVPLDKTRKVVDEALKRWPEEPSIYSWYCIAILPRWGGGEVEWEQWVSAQNKDARWGGKDMDPKLYAQILWGVYRYIKDSDGPPFAHGELSKEKAKLGMDQLCEKYPKSVYWKSVRARFAWAAQDKMALVAAVAALEGTYDPWVILPADFEKMLNDLQVFCAFAKQHHALPPADLEYLDKMLHGIPAR